MTLPWPLFLALLKLLGRRRRFESAEGLRAAVAHDRKTARAEPPAAVRKRCTISQRQVNGHACYTLAPLSSAGTTQLLYLHGGAHVAEISPFHWRLVAELVETTGCVAHVPIFPLAPEHTYRPACAMVNEVYRTLAAAHDPRQLVLMGDSAGGGLALALAQGFAALGLPQPRDIVLVSPWLDLTVTNAAIPALEAVDPWLARPGLAAAGRWWAGDEDPGLPHLSPLHGPLQGLGRLTVFIGTRDLLLADCRALRARAAAQGVPVEWHEAEGMVHVWPLLPVKQAMAARATIAGIVRGRD
ncbi:acetyl esterase/lipase [Variovorax boronicumulans]|uniref:alpha/beta hydrolase fold domain-containing protein n=1 Tax=Variovorax boronicumulans TaxID=436515 RepID=UPI003394D59D